MKLKIEIKKPCHEKWDAMKAESDGRFCLNCKQSVVDFTNKSPIEITYLLKVINNENTCGRFNIWDIKTNNFVDNILWKLNIKGFRYLAIILFCVLLVTGCRTRKHSMGKTRYRKIEFPKF